MVSLIGIVVLVCNFGIIHSQDESGLSSVKFQKITPDSSANPTTMSSSEDPTPDIDASVRERIEEDSKLVGRVAENLVGVQGDINHVEKEVLGKVFDMSSMKTFLDKHEAAIKDHEKFEQEETDLSNQATSLSNQLDHATNETVVQDKTHRAAMSRLGAKVAEDKVVITGLHKELIPLIEMEKEVQRFPDVNSNLTASNTRAAAAAEAATQELLYEKAKLKTYQETTSNLMKELVKQHDYAIKCHARLYQVNTQIHELHTREAHMKYEESQADAKGEAMEKFLEEKNVAIKTRLEKAKINWQTINFAKVNVESQIVALQTDGQSKLEKLKGELGKLRQQQATMEAAMMAKIASRKLIEKAMKGQAVQVKDLQARIVAGILLPLRTNNTQMTSDLSEIRNGLEKSQVATAKAQAKKEHYLWLADHLKNETAATILKAQDVARDALAKVVAVKRTADEAMRKAEEATLQAEASQLTKCDAIWTKDHPKVIAQLKNCKQVKLELDSTKANVASLTATVKASQR